MSKVHEVHTSEVPASFRDSGEEGKLSPFFFFVCQVGLLLAVTPVPPPPRSLSLSLSLSLSEKNKLQPTSNLYNLRVDRFCLIMRMVYMFVFHGVEEDIRSDNDEGEDADVHGKVDDTGNGHSPAHGGVVANGKSKSKTS